MKNNKVHVVLAFVIVAINSLACDICGSYMGITPYDNKSSISFLHRYRVFNGYRNYQQRSSFFPPSAYRTMHGGNNHDSLNGDNHTYSSLDFESYKIFELRFKYFVIKKLELNVFLPILNTRSKTNELYINHTGFSDLSFNAGYHLITPKADKKIRHKLIAGLGIKLPTGNYYAHDSDSDRLPYEMQPGTGSTDGFAYVNYVCMSKKLGASLSLNYKLNGTNKFHEKLGDSQNHFATLFYKLSFKQILWYPSVQANYEYTNGLKIKNAWQNSMRVNALLLGPGLDVYYKSFSINTSWQFAVAERVAEGNLKSAGRISVSLNYSFGKKEI